MFIFSRQAGCQALPSIAIYRAGEQVWLSTVAPKAWTTVTDELQRQAARLQADTQQTDDPVARVEATDQLKLAVAIDLGDSDEATKAELQTTSVAAAAPAGFTWGMTV